MTKAERLREREVQRSIARRRRLTTEGPDFWMGALTARAQQVHRAKVKLARKRPLLSKDEKRARQVLGTSLQLAEWAAHFSRALGGVEEDKVNRATRRAMSAIERNTA